jgi:hypothetical protein
MEIQSLPSNVRERSRTGGVEGEDVGVKEDDDGTGSPFGCFDGGELEEKERWKKKEWG